MDHVQAPLSPARPASDAELAAFKPKLRWRRIAIVAVIAAGLFGLYLLRERQRLEALRDQILTQHERALGDPVQAYRAARGAIEALTVQAATTSSAHDGPVTDVVAGFRWDTLRGRKGMYLRLPAEQATTRAAIATAARDAGGDALPGCLGVEAAAARALFADTDFLSSNFLEGVRREENFMRLRVTETVLARHIDVDLPALLPLLHSEWFLLVLDQKNAPREATADAFLWDLRHQRPLLRARVTGDGVLLSARIRSSGIANAQPLAQAPDSKVARDCSMAAQLRALAPTQQ